MDKKIILGVTVVVILAIVIAIVSPGGRKVEGTPKLPWLITTNTAGESTVFDLTLGSSPLGKAEQILKAEPKLSLFKSPEGVYAIEAYYDRVYLSGLRADFVMTVNVDQAQAEQVFNRGLRISTLGDGTKKVELSTDDKQIVANSAIKLITYLPGADLEPELIEKHFGKPSEVISEDDQISHWLYPEKGLDIAVNNDGKEVMQYLAPKDFEQAVAPLRAQQQK
ncbi:MAG: hypothetical protein OQK12_00235 [Motiliproteus sp.]|nr:hypothetical protein [Motiliproteus sp.]MCW9051082.1 hypothetical protein [Motiliproteus sp.]